VPSVPLKAITTSSTPPLIYCMHLPSKECFLQYNYFSAASYSSINLENISFASEAVYFCIYCKYLAITIYIFIKVSIDY
jgi:hypothetical protein